MERPLAKLVCGKLLDVYPPTGLCRLYGLYILSEDLLRENPMRTAPDSGLCYYRPEHVGSAGDLGQGSTLW